MRKTRKPLIAGIALALVAALGVGATLAWLTDEESVTNTFTVGNISITLDEADVNEYGQKLNDQGKVAEAGDELADRVVSNEYKMVPGMDYVKDPIVTVDEGSEDCWLFVKVAEEGNALGEGKFIEWDIGPLWTELEEGIWYAEYDADANPLVSKYNVITGGEITINENTTKEHMDAFANGTAKPSLAFTAYAVQKAGFDTAADAWSATFGA